MPIISPQPTIALRYMKAPRAGRLLTPRRRAYQPHVPERDEPAAMSVPKREAHAAKALTKRPKLASSPCYRLPVRASPRDGASKCFGDRVPPSTRCGNATPMIGVRHHSSASSLRPAPMRGPGIFPQRLGRSAWAN